MKNQNIILIIFMLGVVFLGYSFVTKKYVFDATGKTCGGFIMNAYQCPDGFICKGEDRPTHSDGPGMCVRLK